MLKRQWIGGGIIVGLMLTCVFSSTADAQDFTWMTPTVTATRETGKISPYIKPPKECTDESFYIGNSFLKDNGCVYHQDGFDYAFVTRSIPTWWGGSYSEQYFTIRFEGESRMHKVNNISTNQYQSIPVPQTRDIIFNTPNVYTYGGTVHIIKDLPSKLLRTIGGDFSVEYTLQPNAYEPLVKGEAGVSITTKAYGVSPNGRWAAVEMMGRGLVRVDLSNFTYRWYSKYTPSYGYGSDGNIQFAVANDGQRIAVAGLNIDPRISEIADTCGYGGDAASPS